MGIAAIRFSFIQTIVIAGAFGIVHLIHPVVLDSPRLSAYLPGYDRCSNFPYSDGFIGTVLITIAVLSAIGLRDPLK